jgi:reverse transcriptase-like protein
VLGLVFCGMLVTLALTVSNYVVGMNRRSLKYFAKLMGMPEGELAAKLPVWPPSDELSLGAPVAYYSKTISAPELNYEIHDKEMLAIVRALEEWRAELEGLQRGERFDVYTDHRALEHFMTTKRLNA